MEINCWRYVQRSIDEVAPEVGGSVIYGYAPKWHRINRDNSGVVAWVFPMKVVIDPSIFAIYMYRKPLAVYPYLWCGHGATLPSARLTRYGGDFLHKGVGCRPVARVTVASDANKFHHNLHLRRHIVA